MEKRIPLTYDKQRDAWTVKGPREPLFFMCGYRVIEYFNVPEEFADGAKATGILSDEYSRQCYELRSFDGGGYVDVIVEGEPGYECIVDAMRDPVAAFIKLNGVCYASFEYEVRE